MFFSNYFITGELREDFWSDVSMAAQENPVIFEHAPKRLKKILLKVRPRDFSSIFQEHGRFGFFFDELRGSPRFMIDLINQVGACGRAFDYATKELKNNIEVAMAAVKLDYHGRIFESLPREMKHNKQLVIAGVATSGYVLKDAPQEMKSSEEVVTAAVKWSGNSLQYASEELRNNTKVVLAAVTRNADALKYASEELRNNKQVVTAAVTAAVTTDGCALKHASMELRGDAGVCVAALRQARGALEHCSQDFFVVAALKALGTSK